MGSPPKQAQEVGLWWTGLTTAFAAPLRSLLDLGIFFYPRNPGIYRVVIGLHHLKKFTSHTIKRRLRAIIIHSGYNNENHDNDVALLKLTRSVRYNKYVQPICLPETSHNNTPNYPCYISGWGRTKEKATSRHSVTIEHSESSLDCFWDPFP
ncbi:hypothetical protein JD844_011111 [Phrynosoma platyrhinos]|uniref:Peptidase S1 domain-containing protein n=1 Tax=Phrynosoma platyrhinos TaxID=52577 RepID=A0ABQ7THU6_PHRPL|nr:hypothetical protein JD844_011111 [Phrynosoma platyrhinos]